MSDVTAPAATAARAIAGALARHAITAAGTALVARGWLDQQTANDALVPVADYIAGGGFALAAASWGALRARLSHGRWAAAWRALHATDG